MIQTSLLDESLSSRGDGQTKPCFKCSRVLPLSEFYAHKTMADGHLNKCKDCTRLDSARNRGDRIEQVRQYDRDRSKLPERRARAAKTVRAWNAKHPEKRAAMTKADNAMRDGRLERQPCEVCGAEYVHAHHSDYARPLDVMWLCPIHHSEWHAKHGRGKSTDDEGTL